MRCRYRSEEEMKDSGVEWIGKIPEAWEVKRLKQVISEPLKYGANESAELDDRNLPRYIRITDFDQDGTLKDETFKSLSYEKAKDYYLKEGDILFARSGATVGKTFLFKKYEGKACFAGYLIKATTNKNIIENDFLYRFTQSKGYENWKNSVFMQATIQNIGADKYRELKLPLPNKKEQKRIIDFMEEKVIQFDTIISKKETLIQTLEEAKKSLISEVVTGKVKVVKTSDGYELVEREKEEMKDSVVEWLGYVPKEWSIKRIKQISEMISKGTTPSTVGRDILDNGDIKFIKAENISNNLIMNSPEFYIDSETNNMLKRSELRENDILFVIAGATIGKTALVNKEICPANTNQAVAFIRLKKNINHEFVLYWLKSAKIQEIMWIYAVQSAQPNLSMENLGNFYIPYPDNIELSSIKNFLVDKELEFNLLINKTEKQIKKLKEAKQALISEAVTGKIEILD